MLLSYIPYALEFLHPFTVHGNTRLRTPSVMVKLESEGFTGYGEACLPPYLGQTVSDTVAFFKRATELLNMMSTEHDLEFVLMMLRSSMSADYSGMAAIDMALNDLYAKLHGKSYRDWKGFDTGVSLPTAHTIGIADTSQLAQKIEEAKAFSILKIKLGTNRDREIIECIRQHTDKPLFVDVNQGWTDKHQALEMITWLNTQNVSLIEQPLPVNKKDDMIWLTERSPVPTIADESVRRMHELKALNGSYAGINIKLMKSAGLGEALRMIEFAKNQGLKIMLGCMAESSCATTAMAQLMQFADFIDLDAPLLYKNDPFTGLTYQNGNIVLNNLPGLGVAPKPGLFPSH
jgi:L-alanine-DL-glutamate epimerase-like enolase superfamily enzyme